MFVSRCKKGIEVYNQQVSVNIPKGVEVQVDFHPTHKGRVVIRYGAVSISIGKELAKKHFSKCKPKEDAKAS